MIPAGKNMAIIFSILSVLFALFPASEGRAGQGFLSYSGVKIKDLKTGLEWAIDAGTPSFKSCPGGKKTWLEAVAYVSCLNSNNYLGHSDWRLPPPHELSSLIGKLAHEEEHELAGPRLKELGFKNIQPSMYWSSVAASGEIALAVEVLTSGESHLVGTLNKLNVWPVRGGMNASKK